MLKILILTGSVRPGRFNIQPAKWIYEIAKEHKDIEIELIDLEKINLPFLDEAAPPSRHKYTKEHTIEWSEKIQEADGFIFVTPEYNHSVSPVLKNAVDYLYQEWNFKPITFVSYGSAGGSRSVEHWRGIAGELKMYDLREQVMFTGVHSKLDENGNYPFSEEEKHTANKMLDSLIFWANAMKKPREELTSKSFS